MVKRIYTKDDYDRVHDIYNEYQAKKDSYTPEQQQKIENAFNQVYNDITQSISERHIIDMYWKQDEPWRTYIHYNDWTMEVRDDPNYVAPAPSTVKRTATPKPTPTPAPAPAPMPEPTPESAPAEPEPAVIPEVNPELNWWFTPDYNNYVRPVATHVTQETYPAWTMMSDWNVIPASYNPNVQPVWSALWWWYLMSDWTVRQEYPVWTSAWQRTVIDWTLLSDWTVVPASFDPNKPAYKKPQQETKKNRQITDPRINMLLAQWYTIDDAWYLINPAWVSTLQKVI